MVIGIDASRANHEEKTGVEWYAWRIIQELKKLKFPDRDIRFILYSDVPLRGALSDLPSGWSSRVLSWPPRRLWTQVRLSFEMMVHPPDVLFIPAHVFPFIHPKKTAMMVHDIAASRFPEAYSRFERWYSLWSARFALKHLWRIFVPSVFTKAELSRIFGGKDMSPIAVVAHGYDASVTEKSVDPPSILSTYHITRPFFLTVGRLEEKKNTVRIIAAFTRYRESHGAKTQLVLVGPPGYGYDAVERAIERNPYRADILCLGWVNQEILRSLFRAAELFLFPSLYEGFGLPILEAFAAGVPVITSRGTSTEEVAGNAAILVDPMNVPAIASAMDDPRLTGPERSLMIARGLARTELFSWESSARQTIALLLE